jgi:hypothetical protein
LGIGTLWDEMDAGLDRNQCRDATAILGLAETYFGRISLPLGTVGFRRFAEEINCPMHHIFQPRLDV